MRHRFAVVYQLHVWPHQRAPVCSDERVVRATQRQGVDIPFLDAEMACAAGNTVACCYGFRSVSGVCATLDSICQTIAWHHGETCQTLLCRHQGLKSGAGQRAARGHHGDMVGFAQGHGGLQGGLYANDGQQGVFGLAVGRVGAVGDVDETFVRQLGP